MTDVDEVVGAATDEGEVEVPFVEPPNRFDKIKESYKGVTTALDLSEETAAYEDFQSLLTGQKVRITRSQFWPRRSRCRACLGQVSCLGQVYVQQDHHPSMHHVTAGSRSCVPPRKC